MQTTPSMNWGRETSPRPCILRNERNFPRLRSLLPMAHKPKRSATADRKEAPSANRENRRTISVPFSLSCAAFEFIRAYTFGTPSFLIKNTTNFAGFVLRYERLQVIRKIPARDQAVEACLRELAWRWIASTAPEA